MIKTQIQLPDALYRELKRVAREREMSLAEILRRGAEAFLCRHPETPPTTRWTLPDPQPLGGDAFFENPDWRFHIHSPALVRERGAIYPRGRRRSKS